MATQPSVRLPAATRRRQLLGVALEVFADRGFDGTSMSDLAEAAGVTKPVLYQHFGSKRALYLELLDDVGAQIRNAVAEAATAAVSRHEQVEAGFVAYFRFVAAHRAAFRLLLGGSSRRDDQFDEAVWSVEQAIADTIGSLIASEVAPEDRALAAHAMVGMAEWMSRRWLRGDAAESDPDELGRRMAELAWSGLRGVRVVD